MKELRGGDLRRACLVPSSVFARPDEVVQSDLLSYAQKLAILRRWEFDARRVAGFTSPSGSKDALLMQVRRALQDLNSTHLRADDECDVCAPGLVAGTLEAKRV